MDIQDLKAKDAADYYPTLFIGLGGTGMRVIKTIKLYGTPAEGQSQAYDRDLADALERGRIKLFGIDTDEYDAKSAPVRPEAFPQALQHHIQNGRLPGDYPTIDEYLYIDRTAINGAIKGAKEAAYLSRDKRKANAGQNAAADLVASYLPVRRETYDSLLPPGNESAEGAGQMRALGRIAFLTAVPNIYRLLMAAFSEVEQESSGRRPRVVIASSLAGGTGSGMFLDIAMLIRFLVSEDAHITGHFLLPEVFAARSLPQRLWPNSYAALQELTHMARPRNARPFEIRYPINTDENRFMIRAGKTPFFDDVFLYDDSAAALDWHANPARRFDAAIDACARSIADSSLALSRADLLEPNKNRQNLLIGRDISTSVADRVFHAASGIPWEMKPASKLSTALDLELNELLFGREFHQRCQPPATARHIAVSDMADALRKMSNDPAAEKLSADQTELDTLATVKGETNWLKNLHRTALGFSLDRRKDIIKRLESKGVRNILEQVAFNADFEKNRDANPEMEIPAWVFIQNEPKQRLSALFEMITAFEEHAAAKRGLSDRDANALTALIAAIKGLRDRIPDPAETDPKAEKDEKVRALDEVRQRRAVRVRIPDEVFGNETVLRWLFLSESSLGDKLEALKRYGPGAFADDLARIVAQIANSAQQVLNVGDPNLTNRLCRNDACRFWATSPEFDQWLNRLEKAREAINDNQKAMDRRRDAINRQIRPKVIIDEEEAAIEFHRVLAPLAPLMAGIREVELNGGLRTERDEAALHRRTRIVGFVGSAAGHLSEDGVAGHHHETIFTRLMLEMTEGEPPNEKNFLTRFAQALCGPHIELLRDTIMDITGADSSAIAGRKLELLQEFTRDLVQGLISMEEFELSRLGNREGIAQTARTARNPVFRAGASVGQLNARYATLALPHFEGATDRESRSAVGHIETAVRQALAERPFITSYSSRRPVILYENRYNAPHEISNIAKYSRHYRSLSQHERALFHVLPQSIDFPPIVSEELQGAEAPPERWTCNQHDEPFEVSSHERICPQCVREYIAGRRRLTAVNVQNDHSQMAILDPMGDIAPEPEGSAVFIGHYVDGIAEPDLSDLETLDLIETRDQEKPLTHSRVWKDDNPPNLVLPRVPNASGTEVEWVARSRHHKNRFLRLSDETPMMECYHCGFPMATDLAQRPGVAVTCPRCRRDLEYCRTCSQDHHMLYQPLRGASGKEHTCPQCDSQMEDGRVE